MLVLTLLPMLAEINIKATLIALLVLFACLAVGYAVYSKWGMAVGCWAVYFVLAIVVFFTLYRFIQEI